MPPKILVSAGEASGDLYAAGLVEALRRRNPDAEFFGCAGPRMQQVGVRAVVDAARLAVVGLVEVVAHIPRIYGEYRKLVRAAEQERPQLAILTDSPDFHLRLARQLRRLQIPVVYLVAPQVWAWRKGRLPVLRRYINRLLCIFPFEEDFFRQHDVPADYIGHPLTRLVRPAQCKEEFLARHGLDASKPLITLLPGSRMGEIGRHLPTLVEAADLMQRQQPCQFVWATPIGFSQKPGSERFQERISASSIKRIEGETWDAIAHADLVLAASGTVTVEAALLSAPMVTFYRVTGLSWFMGKFLVSVPFYSMVNLVAGRLVVPELMQEQMTGPRLAAEALRLLNDDAARQRMRQELQSVAAHLATHQNPLDRAATIISELMENSREHVA